MKILEYVYIIGWQEVGCYKIGISRSPDKRIHQLEANLPFPLEIIVVRQVEDSAHLERCLHHANSERRLKNEWFRLSQSELAVCKSFIDCWDTMRPTLG